MIPFVFQWSSTQLNKQIMECPSLLPTANQGHWRIQRHMEIARPDETNGVCSDQHPVLDKTYITSFRAKFSSSKNREDIAEEEVSFNTRHLVVPFCLEVWVFTFHILPLMYTRFVWHGLIDNFTPLRPNPWALPCQKRFPVLITSSPWHEVAALADALLSLDVGSAGVPFLQDLPCPVLGTEAGWAHLPTPRCLRRSLAPW